MATTSEAVIGSIAASTHAERTGSNARKAHAGTRGSTRSNATATRGEPKRASTRATSAKAKTAIHYPEEEVKNHLPLVRQVVQRMLARKPPEIPTEDLISWGTIGLLDAMRKYDSKREASFATYAQYRIRGSILDFLRRCDWLPRSIRQKSHDMEAATLRLERRFGRPPGDEEIAKEMDLSLGEYASTVAALGSSTMIAPGDLAFGRGEEVLTDDHEFSDSGDHGPMKNVLQKERVVILGRAIEALPEKERIVVSLYYSEGLTMREMADAMHLTEGRISQLHSQAMGRLRKVLADTRPEIAFDN
ncbi:MAG: FliA/WhiG family RNA polymerase sigma factor [Candidatus Binatia bacterium]|nr:FliA/WhiG family RNA polymerase sigma factor [Candidatus Binatia bacterium]